MQSHDVQRHRGGNLRAIGASWHAHIIMPDVDDVPMPDFGKARTCFTAVLQRRGGSVDAQSHEGDDSSSEEPHSLQDQEGEESASQQGEEVFDDEDSCNQDASQASDGEGSDVQPVSFAAADSLESQLSGSVSRGRAVKQPPPIVGTSDAESEISDSVLEEEQIRKAIAEDPDLQFVYRKIYRRASKEEDVGSSDAKGSSCKFSLGDIIRPILCLAELPAYRFGAICHVVAVDADGDPIVSYHDDNGNLSSDVIRVYAQHFVKVCTEDVFEEDPNIPRSTWVTVLNSYYWC